MELPLFVLVLQIGFNAALNNHGYSSNSVIPSPRFVNSGQTRRIPNTYNYISLSSRGLPESDEQTDSEYSNSLEDYSYRSVRPLQSRSNQRKNDYLSHDTKQGNDVSLDAAPVRRINSDNYADSFRQSPYLSRRTDPYFRRPNLGNIPSNPVTSYTSQYYRKNNDDLSLEVSSLESSHSEGASRLGEEATYLRSLLSLIDQPSNRRGQNRKYYRQGNSLSSDISPIDKLNPSEEALNSVPNSYNKRRNNNPDANAGTIILVNEDDDQTGETPISVNPQPTGSVYNTLYNRRYDDELNPNEYLYNHLSPFHGLNLRQRGQKLTDDSPLTRKFSRESNNNADAESPLKDELLTDGDNTGKLTVLRLASLEDLSRSNNRKSNHRNFLRFSLSPDNKLTLDEGVASDLSEILSETLDELNLTPVNLRRTDVTSNRYSIRENNKNSAKDDNMFLLRLGNSYNSNTASPIRRYSKPINRSNNRNLRTHGNHTREKLKNVSLPPLKFRESIRNGNRYLRTHGNHSRQEFINFKKYFDEHAARNLVPYHEGKSNQLLNNSKNVNQNNNSKNEDINLDTLSAFKKEDNALGNLTVLPPLNQNNLSLETPRLRNSDKSLPKNTTDELHLEFPWNDQMSSDSDKNKSQLRSDDKKDNTKDNTLNLEFPWNNALSSDSDKDKSQLRTDERKNKTKDTTDMLELELPWNEILSPNADKSKSPLRSDDKKDKTKDTTDNLQLEFPWNDALRPDNDKGKSQLRSDEKEKQNKDTTDNLQLEFPWNDALRPNNDKGKSQLRSDEKEKQNKDTTDNLQLEFPWNDALRPDHDKVKSQLRSDEKEKQNKDTTDNLHLEFPWNDAVRPDNDEGKSQLRSDEKEKQNKDTTDNLHLEFPWNDAVSPDSNQEKSKLRMDETKDKTKDSTDVLNLEFPWNDVLSPDADKTKSQLRTNKNMENTTDNTDSLDLEFPWNDALSPDSHKNKSPLRSKDNTMDTLNLEFPWNEQLSPDKTKAGGPKPQSLLRSKDRQDKEPKDELKLEFPWNDKTSSDKPLRKQTTLRIPDPFFIHPYLRNRNVMKHPNYFRRSYDKFNQGLRVQNLRDNKSAYHRRQSKRRRNDNLGVIGLARRSSDRRRHRLRTREDKSPLVTTTLRPKYSRSLRRAGQDRKTYNDTIIFPKN